MVSFRSRIDKLEVLMKTSLVVGCCRWVGCGCKNISVRAIEGI